MTRINLNYIPEQGLHAMELAIADELDRAFDLKNRRVVELEKRFDRLDRQLMQGQRRAMLVAQRRKK